MAAKTSKFYGYKAMVFMVVMMFCIYGVFSVFSVMMTDIMTRLNIDAAQLGFAITARSIVGFLVSIFAYKIYDRIKPNICMILSAFGMVAMIATFLWGPLWSIYLSSVLFGFCMGTGMQVGMPVFVSAWFVDRRAEMIGYGFAGVNAGTALGAIIFGILAGMFDNMTASTIMMVLFGGVSIIASFFLRNPESMGQKPLGFGKISDENADASADENLPGLTAVQTRKTLSFWLVVVAFVCIGMGSVGLSYITVVVTAAGFDASEAAFAYAAFCACGALGMVVYGNIISRIGFKPYLIVSAIITIIGFYLYAFSTVSGWESIVPFCIATGLAGLGKSGLNLFASTSVPELFGERSIKGTTPFFQNTLAIGAGLSSSILTMLVTLTGTWTLELVVNALLITVGIVLLFASLAFAPIKKWRLEHPNFAAEVAARIAKEATESEAAGQIL